MAGINGDWYLNTTTFEIFHKENDIWVSHGIIKGGKGDAGDKGDTGDTGAKGDIGEAGAKGDKGDAGDAGAAGSAWLSGASDPT